MMQRKMGMAAAVLMCAGAMLGCQPKHEDKPAPAPSAPTPAEPPKPAVAEPAPAPAAEPPAPQEEELITPDKAVKMPGADPGWPAPGAKPAMVSRTPDGAVLEDYVVGEGFPTLPGAVVTFHYVARVKDGAMFDSTYGPNTPRTTTTAGLMPALQDGVIGMKKGGKRRMILEPRMAYGDRGLTSAQGEVVVPPGATVIFDVELVDLKQTLVKPGAEAPKGPAAPGGVAPANK